MHEFVWFQNPSAKVVEVQGSGEVGVGDVSWKNAKKGVFFDHGVTCCLMNCIHALRSSTRRHDQLGDIENWESQACEFVAIFFESFFNQNSVDNFPYQRSGEVFCFEIRQASFCFSGDFLSQVYGNVCLFFQRFNDLVSVKLFYRQA